MTAPADNLRYWFEADYMVTTDSTGVISWADRMGQWDVRTPLGGNTPPKVAVGEFNGRPGIYFGTLTGTTVGKWSLIHYGGPGETGTPQTVPINTPYPFAANEPHILYVVCKPFAGMPPPGGGVAGGMLVTDRDTFSRQLWTLSDTQQRVAQGSSVVNGVSMGEFLYVDPAVDYVEKPLLILYRWTGSEMFVTVNDVPQQTRNLDSGAPSAAFAPVPDDPGNHVLEIGGSSSAESGFQGAIAAVLLAPDLTPNPQTVDYLKSKWGPFP